MIIKIPKKLDGLVKDHNPSQQSGVPPDSEGINDLLLISAASEVEEIESMKIFDRWGNMVFLTKNFPPNDPAFAWDGKRDDEALNPAFFAYRLNARFKDGRFEIRNKDVTLIR